MPKAKNAIARTRYIIPPVKIDKGQKPMVRCKVCNHPDAAAINRLLGQGLSLRDVSGRYKDVSFPSVARHSRNCLGRRNDEGPKPQRPRQQDKTTIKVPQSRVAEEPLDAEAQLAGMIDDVRAVMAAARESNDLRLLILA